jgi:cell division protease FtsH
MERKMTAESNKEPRKNIIETIRSFSGFKSSPPQKVGLHPKSGFNIWYLLIFFVIITVVQQFFLSPKVETIPYSQFKQYVAEGKVSTLIIEPEKVRGTQTEK